MLNFKKILTHFTFSIFVLTFFVSSVPTVFADACLCIDAPENKFPFLDISTADECNLDALSTYEDPSEPFITCSIVGCYNGLGCDEGFVCSETVGVGMCELPPGSVVSAEAGCYCEAVPGQGIDDVVYASGLTPDNCVSELDESREVEGVGVFNCAWYDDTSSLQPPSPTGPSGPPPRAPSAGAGLLIPCAVDGSCHDIGDLLAQAIKITEFLLGLVGTIALIMFVIGGIQYITSFGSSDKVKKAQQTLIGAVIGIIITFSAYLLIQFVVEALGISSYFIS